MANNKHIPDNIPENEAYETARSRRVRLIERRKGSSGSLQDFDEDVDGEAFRDFLSNRGVLSVVIDSLIVSVTPVVSEEGFVGGWIVICGGVRESVSEWIAALANFRDSEKSITCVYSLSVHREPEVTRLGLTITRQMKTSTPSTEKYATKAGRRKSSRRSSRERVGSGTMPNTAMRIAPPAMKKVPSIIQGEKTSPNINRAKKAFQSRDTAPNGASMTTGRDAI